MTNYLIEFRFHGYARKYSIRIIYDVSKKFKVKGVTRRKVVPHISMFGSFETRNEKKMVSEIVNVASKYTIVPFTVKGFNYFDNPGNKVIFLDIEPSEELKQLRYDLACRLRKITTKYSPQDRKDKENFYFHATIAFKDIDRKFDRIWHYLKKKEEPNIKQHLLRITILKRSKILYEYDLIQKRLLNRKQSLNHQMFLTTVKILKNKLSSGEYKQEFKTEPEKISIWDKIKSFFRVK